MPASTIIAALRQQLGEHLPFSAMAREDLDFLINQSSIAYYAPDEVIVSPADGVPAYCVIVKQGRVHATSTVTDSAAFDAGVGDCFPVGALLAERPVTLTYRAVGDTFCLLLQRSEFDELTRRSAVFLEFCKRRLGVLLDQSRQQLQQSYAGAASVERTMATPLAELSRRQPVTCSPDATLREAFGRMHEAHVGSIVVVQRVRDDESVAGILTRTDLIGRVILPELPLTTAVGQVMTTGVKTLDAAATAADATLLMAEHSIRHIPIMRRENGRQQVVAVVSERDLFVLQRLGVRQLSAELKRATSLEALIAVAADIRRLSHHFVAQGVPAAQLTKLISRLNDQLTVRLLTLISQQAGIAADSFCWLSFGSEGRHEQTIATDQDNGLLYVDGTVERGQLLEFADRANAALAACGFPLCKGNIMARNPQWCLTYSEWQSLFADWIDQGDPEALLHASIFFDFRPLFGATALAHRLREEVVKQARNERFLKQMADNALRNRPPGGSFIESLFSGASAEVDLKLHGTMPLVDGARIWSYSNGVFETNTSERFARLIELQQLPELDARAWIAAFEFFQLMRLREQHRRMDDSADGRNPNLVRLQSLSALDRRVINEAFRQTRKLQQRLELDFPG